MKLVISLATRGRPQQLIETIARSTANLALPNTVFQVQADADDQATIDAISAAPLDQRVVLNIRAREDTIAAKWNRALAEPADVYLVCGDDDPYITPGYDSLILDAATRFPDGIGMVYGNMANASFSGSVAPTAKLCEKLGYIQPEHFPYWFCDHWTDDLARMIGRISCADIRTDQSHVGQTQELREPAWWATWFDAAYLMRRAEARAIIDDPEFQSPEWLKSILRTHHSRVECYSRYINDNVRAQAAQLEGMSRLTLNDERYQRVRQRAVAMISHLIERHGMHVDEALAYRRALLPQETVVGLRRAFA